MKTSHLRSLYMGKLGKNALRVLVVLLAIALPVFVHSATKTYFFEAKARSACKAHKAKFAGLIYKSGYVEFDATYSSLGRPKNLASISTESLTMLARSGSGSSFRFVPVGVSCDHGIVFNSNQDRFVQVRVHYFASGAAANGAISLLVNIFAMLLLAAEVFGVIYLVFVTLSTKPRRAKKTAK